MIYIETLVIHTDGTETVEMRAYPDPPVPEGEGSGGETGE